MPCCPLPSACFIILPLHACNGPQVCYLIMFWSKVNTPKSDPQPRSAVSFRSASQEGHICIARNTVVIFSSCGRKRCDTQQYRLHFRAPNNARCRRILTTDHFQISLPRIHNRICIRVVILDQVLAALPIGGRQADPCPAKKNYTHMLVLRYVGSVGNNLLNVWNEPKSWLEFPVGGQRSAHPRISSRNEEILAMVPFLSTHQYY